MGFDLAGHPEASLNDEIHPMSGQKALPPLRRPTSSDPHASKRFTGKASLNGAIESRRRNNGSIERIYSNMDALVSLEEQHQQLAIKQHQQQVISSVEAQ